MEEYNKLHEKSLEIAEAADNGNKDFDAMYNLISEYDYTLKLAFQYIAKLEKLIISKELEMYNIS